MAEILEGIVVGIEGEFARVRPKRHTACDDCQACNTADLIVLAVNASRAAVGQTVQYTQAQRGIVTVAWVLFVQPLLAVFAGIGLGSVVAQVAPIPEATAMGIGALVLFAAAVGFVLWFDKRFKLNRSNFAKITGILS
jgi:sigma-E factor negative regulatory protein RseC